MASRFVLGFIMFVFFTGGMITIYEATQNQPLVYNPQNDFNVGNIGIAGSKLNPKIITNQSNIGIAAGQNNTQVSHATGCDSTSPAYALCLIEVLGNIAYCDIAAAVGSPCNSVSFNNSIQNAFDANSQSSVVSSNYQVFQILADPAVQAVAIAITFLALGILAGTFGAGILANVMGRVGIALALFYYMNAQMTLFGSVTDFWFDLVILAPLNLLLAAGSIVLIQESMGGGKES